MKRTKNSHLTRVIQLIAPYKWLMVGTVFSALLLSYLSIVRPRTNDGQIGKEKSAKNGSHHEPLVRSYQLNYSGKVAVFSPFHAKKFEDLPKLDRQPE